MQTGDLGSALCVITGASRGFGRTLARHVARWLKPGSVLVLAARSGPDLRALQTELTASGTGPAVRCVAADLATKEGVARVVGAAAEASTQDVDHLMLVNNAGSLGDVSRYTRDVVSMSEVDSYLSFNVSSALCVTTGVLRAVPPRPGLKRTVVNVTSLCALQPFPSWVLYCTGKAAREMMFKVLAEEEPDIRVLNYSPGPLDTAMQAEARSSTADPGVRDSFSAMFAQGQLLTCDASCAKLLTVLLKDEYRSGDHVDFYDL
ncbi:sepiapterin reductase-like [Lampris incognitus]|uniref:sepiapterin reductase-like n=1 Tax=Lampris incognitus TaxID=2546036 RepID=UPI0024B4D764|nr:sepiapterin reductase-like [Lampris incognitus]